MALQANTTGASNTAIGGTALYANTTGYNNAAFGYNALPANTTGNYNTVIGSHGSDGITTGGYNVTIGDQSVLGTVFNITSESNRGIFGHNAITNAYVKVAWTVTSDQRDKADITNFTHGLDYINALRPVNYVWDERSNYADGVSDGSKKKDLPQLGFLAQEIEAVETSLGITNNCVVDKEDVDNLKITETKLIPILVNAIKELSAKNDALETQNATFAARLTALEGV